MPKSTKSKPTDKPPKPYADYPLYPHSSGRWAKKIRGRTHFFGRWGHVQSGEVVQVENVKVSAAAALEQFQHDWPYLQDGRTPPPADPDACTMHELCNAFLRAKKRKLDAEELSARTFEDYYRTCQLLIGHFRKERRVDDLRPDDFAALRKTITSRWGVVKVRNEITRIRMVFNFAWDERLIDQPTHYGQSFSPPSAKMLRKARNETGPRMIEAEELRRILDTLDGKAVEVEGEEEPLQFKRDPVMKAMVLLALNCGFGNTDVATLPQSAVDLESGWIDFPRPKTEIPRRVPLWPETVAALRDALASRPQPKRATDMGLCFLTLRGTSWLRVEPTKENEHRYSRRDQVSTRFSALLKKLNINGRPGLGFYTLRHVFETIAGESKDQVAVNAIMGHVDNSMAAVYRERISDERLRAVVDCVHGWLFAEPAKSADAA